MYPYLVKAQHVHHTNLCNATAEQVWPLVDTGGHKQTAIAATLDDQLARSAVVLLLQILGTCL